MRLAVRIAREIHLPITEVLQLPARELNLWAAVFSEESGKTPEETEENDITGASAFKMLGGDIAFKAGSIS